MAESVAGDALFERTGKVSFVQVLPHALQHVLAAFAGIVTPAIIIASVCGFTPQEEAAVIQASLVLSGFLGGVPTATFGQNVGIIAENKVVNRMVFTLAAAILLVAGLLPKCAAVLTSIPQPVIGGATIGVFATIGMNGVVMFSRHGLSQRDTTLMGLSIAFGTGIERTAGALAGAGFPAWVDTVFGGSSIAVAALVAVVLNLVLPRQK
ncbi:MAG: solute carrier family 23 protein [Collinsella sp.]|nr:solute carrier family 23 protein [Collinsella sp.]